MTTTKDNLRENVLSIINDIENGVKADPDYNKGYEEGEYISGYEYLSEALDIEYALNSDGSFKGARVLVAFGGPNIWINTVTQQVEGYWWGEDFTESFRDDAMEITAVLEDLFEALHQFH